MTHSRYLNATLEKVTPGHSDIFLPERPLSSHQSGEVQEFSFDRQMS